MDDNVKKKILRPMIIGKSEQIVLLSVRSKQIPNVTEGQTKTL